MSYMENVQKPIENIQISWFGGYRERMWGAFFSDFLVLGVLWWILGCTLAVLGRYNAPGSGFGKPLGAEREPLGDFWVRSPTRLSKGEPGLAPLKYAFYISYMYTKTLRKNCKFHGLAVIEDVRQEFLFPHPTGWGC